MTFLVSWRIHIGAMYRFTSWTPEDLRWRLPALDQDFVGTYPLTISPSKDLHAVGKHVWAPETKSHAWASNIRANAPGFIAFSTHVFEYPQGWNPECYRAATSLARLTPITPWSAATSVDPEILDLPQTRITEIATGWPFIALRDSYQTGAGRTVYANAPSISHTVLDLAVYDYMYSPGPKQGPRVRLPIVPIWPGFLLNTFFYGAMLWMVARLANATRRGVIHARRRRRGQCPFCTYPQMPDGPCPECGGNFRTQERIVGWSAFRTGVTRRLLRTSTAAE